MEALVFLLLIAATFGALGGYVSSSKGRDKMEGILLGALFGPIGCLIAVLLPSQHSRP